MADELTSATQRSDTPAAVIRPREVDVGRGVAWWGEGWRLFTPAVGPWLLIVVIGFGLHVVLAFIPILGSLASQLLFPIFAGGLMLGCRAIDRGEPLTIAHLFAGFGARVVALISLAAAIAITVFVIALLFVFFGAAVLSQLWGAQDSVSTAAAMGGLALIVLVGLLIFLLLFLPLVMAGWL